MHSLRLPLRLLRTRVSVLRPSTLSLAFLLHERQRTLYELLHDHTAGQPVDHRQLAVLASLVARTPEGAAALHTAAGLVTRGEPRRLTEADLPPLVSGAGSVAAQWAAVLRLDGLCVADHFCHAPLAVRRTLCAQVVALRRQILVAPRARRLLSPLAREIRASAPPQDRDLALYLWQTLAELDGSAFARRPVVCIAVALLLTLASACASSLAFAVSP